MKKFVDLLSETSEKALLEGYTYDGLSKKDEKGYLTVSYKSNDGRGFWPLMISAKLTNNCVEELLVVLEKHIKKMK